jgi:hypothetical protein
MMFGALMAFAAVCPAAAEPAPTPESPTVTITATGVSPGFEAGQRGASVKRLTPLFPGCDVAKRRVPGPEGSRMGVILVTCGEARLLTVAPLDGEVMWVLAEGSSVTGPGGARPVTTTFEQLRTAHGALRCWYGSDENPDATWCTTEKLDRIVFVFRHALAAPAEDGPPTCLGASCDPLLAGKRLAAIRWSP